MKNDLKKVKNRFITEISALELDKYKKLKLEKLKIENQIEQLNIELKENLKLQKNNFNQVQKNRNLLKKEDKNIYKLETEISEEKQEKEENINKFQEINLFSLPLILNKKLLNDVKNRSQFLQIDDKETFEDRFSKFSEIIISNQNNFTKNELLNHFYTIFGDSILNLDVELSTQNLKNILQNITSSKNRLHELSKKKNSFLNLNSSEKIENLKTKIKNLENEEKLISEKFDEINTSLENKQAKLKEINSQIRQEFIFQKSNFGTINSIESIEKLLLLTEKIYNTEIQKALATFNQKFKINLKYFYDKYPNIQNIEIDNNFNIFIFNNELELLSAGQKHILVFIFIFTILEIYKITDFIFVDTPFGRLSKENRKYLKDIYEKFNQLIVLATNTEEEVFEKSNYDTFKIKLFEDKGVKFWL
jgi:DNA repair exonuclease SbcCD ATPase subunit